MIEHKHIYQVTYNTTYLLCTKTLSCSCRQKDKIGTEAKEDAPNPQREKRLAAKLYKIVSHVKDGDGKADHGHANPIPIPVTKIAPKHSTRSIEYRSEGSDD